MNLILCGCSGRMGKAVAELCASNSGINIVAGVDTAPLSGASFPVFTSILDCTLDADCIVDFSHPSTLSSVLSFCSNRRIPAVLCTTGYSDSQINDIRNASAHIPVFRSANMSLGINVMQALVKQAVRLLGEDFDIEIVERHHNQKLDAPSGTAIMLADSIREARTVQTELVYERQSVRRKRDPKEVGISSIRGGTIVGVHEVIFAGHDEVLEIEHTAQSRSVFAAGAVRAAQYLIGKEPGIYSMTDLVNDLLEK